MQSRLRKLLVPQEDALGLLPCCFVLFWVPPLRLCGCGLGWADVLPAPDFPSPGAAPRPSWGKPSPVCAFSALTLPNPGVSRADLGSAWCPLRSFPTRLQTTLSRFVVDIFCFAASVASRNSLFRLQTPMSTEPVTTSLAYPPWST